MPKLSLSVRVAASSICALSLLHLFFWAYVAIASRGDYPDAGPYTLLSPVAFAFSLLGIVGILVGVGVFRARAWARIAALVLAALVAISCAFGLFALLLLFAGVANSLGLEIHSESKSYLVVSGCIYFVVLGIALWWIFLFSRSSVAGQFSSSQHAAPEGAPRKATCPPPIALLGWLMIVSGALSAISWPILLGKIPAMLFNHIFSSQTSQFIWAINTLLFLACGIGLLRLQRWSYTGTIALHTFWLVSLFVTQISPQYPRYLGLCFAALETDQSATYFINFHLSPLLSAIGTAIPTALLIAGLFYYRPSFLRAVNDSRHLTS